MNSKDADDYIFQYFLDIRYGSWRFRDLPHHVQLEAEAESLGRKEFAIEENADFQQEFFKNRTDTLWKRLQANGSGKHLIPFKIAGQVWFNRDIADKPVNFTPADIRIGQGHECHSSTEQIYYFTSDGVHSQVGVLYSLLYSLQDSLQDSLQGKRKLVIPFSRCNWRIYSCWPDGYQPIFYNAQFIEQAKIVIITDDIACADFFQKQLERCGIYDIAWVSWHGDLEKYPWVRLMTKAVYFFVEPHSGLTVEQLLDKAAAVQKQLTLVNGAELKLIFWSIPKFLQSAFPYLTNIPLIKGIGEWHQWLGEQVNRKMDQFENFRHKVTPRSRGRSQTRFDIKPIIVHGNRILVSGSGSGSSERLFLLALFAPFCSSATLSTPEHGVVMYVRHDQLPNIDDWLDILRSRGIDYKSLSPDNLPLEAPPSISSPELFDVALNISDLKNDSVSDCVNLLSLIGYATQSMMEPTSQPKILVIDSLGQFLRKAHKETLGLLDDLRKSDWTVIILESKRAAYFKVFQCDQEISVKSSPAHTGTEVICTTETIYGKLKKIFHINLLDHTSPILTESAYNRKSRGLMRPRADLVAELRALLAAGAKGKEIAKRLDISESMVKKLKREIGLSKPRRSRTTP